MINLLCRYFPLIKNQTAKSRQRNSAVTLIELIVAVFLSSFVIGLAFYAWAGIIKHNGRSERRAILANETQLVLGAICTNLARSPKILYLSRDEARFVSATTGDTITYRFTGESILKNGENLLAVSDKACIRHFAIAKVSTENPLARQILVKLALTVGNASGDTCALQSQITIQSPDDASSSVEWQSAISP